MDIRILMDRISMDIRILMDRISMDIRILMDSCYTPLTGDPSFWIILAYFLAASRDNSSLQTGQ